MLTDLLSFVIGSQQRNLDAHVKLKGTGIHCDEFNEKWSKSKLLISY